VARRDLRVSGAFPQTDVKIRAYVDGLPKQVKRYSARLATNGFGKEMQARLEHLSTHFGKLLVERTKERGDVRAARVTRDTAFEKVRYFTGFFRRHGQAALRETMERGDFDRVKPTAAKKGAKGTSAIQSTAGADQAKNTPV